MGGLSTKICNGVEYIYTKTMFFDYFYYETDSFKEIENKVIEFNAKRLNDSNKMHDVYFALADCEWMCGGLSQEIVSKVEEIVASGADIEYWKSSLNVPTRTLERREKALTAFLEKLKTPKDKPMIRWHRERFVYPLKKGDVFTYHSKTHDLWGCGVVLDLRESPFRPWEEEFNFRALVAVSEYAAQYSPVLEYALQSIVKDVYWDGGNMYTLPKRDIIVLGNVAEQIDDDYSNYFGAIAKDGEVVYNTKQRLSFEEQLVTKYDIKRVDKFSVINKPMTFFFNKNNLRTTEDFLNDKTVRKYFAYL
ncbi:MAG: hypothetical protein HDT29_05440 [Clostridiales bacterium]|nr:hypothetical protein [Clostridiales bacterium]